MALYFERQSGDNCRIHAINNCFGEKVLDKAEFQKFHEEFKTTDKVDVKDNYVNSGNWDRSNLLSYILSRKFGLTCFTLGQYELSRFRRQNVVRGIGDFIDTDLNRFFVCDKGHVWCVRLVGGRWMCIDSLNAPRATTLQQWERNPALTLVFPWTLKRSTQALSEMRELVRRRFATATGDQIKQLIVQDLSEREPTHFGDHQTWIALFFKYLQLRSPEHEIIARFKRYETASKLDASNALDNLPALIHFIIDYER